MWVHIPASPPKKLHSFTLYPPKTLVQKDITPSLSTSSNGVRWGMRLVVAYTCITALLLNRAPSHMPVRSIVMDILAYVTDVLHLLNRTLVHTKQWMPHRDTVTYCLLRVAKYCRADGITQLLILTSTVLFAWKYPHPLHAVTFNKKRQWKEQRSSICGSLPHLTHLAIITGHRLVPRSCDFLCKKDKGQRSSTLSWFSWAYYHSVARTNNIDLYAALSL